MYMPPAFRVEDIAEIHRTMREARSATLVTATEEGLIGTPVPMLLDETEGANGTLYAHVARSNPQWKLQASCEAMANFAGPEAYVTPSWYVTKQETHRSCQRGTTLRYMPTARSSFSTMRTGYST